MAHRGKVQKVMVQPIVSVLNPPQSSEILCIASVLKLFCLVPYEIQSACSKYIVSCKGLTLNVTCKQNVIFKHFQTVSTCGD